MIERISQSFIKDFTAYLHDGMCGNLIRERYVNGRSLEDPEAEPGAMQLGIYFEFIATGNLPKSGQIPQPVWKKRSLSKPIEKRKLTDMTEPYQLAHARAEQLKGYLTWYGLKIQHVGRKITLGRFEGSLDLICEATKQILVDDTILDPGEQIIIDLKYAATLNDKTPRTNKHGWKWSEVQKAYHGIQAVHYSMLGRMKFFFLVISSAKEDNAKFFYVPVDDFAIEQHILVANGLHDKFKFMANANGFLARPDLRICAKCALRRECPDKMIAPGIEVVNLNE